MVTANLPIQPFSGDPTDGQVPPYPSRDPQDEQSRLLTTSLDDLESLNHYCFGGRRDFQRGFRALVAGGGTGDATIFLAHQLRQTDATIVHADNDPAAIDIARQRARFRDLEDRIEWICAEVDELPKRHLGRFDYVHCSSALRFSRDPAACLRLLTEMLKDDGAIGLMLEARTARTGIDQVRSLLQLINDGVSDVETRIEHARRTVQSLPKSNWFCRGQHLYAQPDACEDADWYDAFLHETDHAFDVEEVYDLLSRAGLHFVEFTHQYRILYDPMRAMPDREIAQRLSQLSAARRQTASELFWGSIRHHTFWASKQTGTVADPRDKENVPFFSRLFDMRAVRNAFLNSADDRWSLRVSRPGGIAVTIELAADAVTRRFLELIDGHRTMGAIVHGIATSTTRPRPEADVWRTCLGVLETLRTYDLVLLRHSSVPPLQYD